MVNKPGYIYEFMLGASYGGLVNTEATTAFNNPPSEWTYKIGVERYTAGHAKEYYDGYPQVTWFFPVLKPAAWQYLEALFSGTNVSEDMYIRTKTDDDTYEYFTCIMHKPEMGDSVRRGVGAFFDVLIRFTQLEVYTPP